MVSKVWHSNDKYRRMVWRCNHKYKEHGRSGKGCSTPHLTEDEVKAAFVKMANQLITDREFYLTELNYILERLGDTAELKKEKRKLDEQLRVDAKAMNDLIAQNARVAQNQKEYNERYDAMASRYEEAEEKHTEIIGKINQVMVRRRKIERFIQSVSEPPKLFTEFDPAMWAALVETMTVYSKERIFFKLTCGMEIEV